MPGGCPLGVGGCFRFDFTGTLFQYKYNVMSINTVSSPEKNNDWNSLPPNIINMTLISNFKAAVNNAPTNVKPAQLAGRGGGWGRDGA